jgi:hypothetical protein
MPKADEIWTTRDGQKIAVGDMDEQHVRNALRMILRARRKMARTILDNTHDFHEDNGQDMLNDQYRRDLSNPKIFFPLIGEGVYGSEELAKRFKGSI